MYEQDALRTYLLRKLDFMGKEDRSQITMIATWSAELYLDKVYLEIHSAIQAVSLDTFIKGVFQYGIWSE